MVLGVLSAASAVSLAAPVAGACEDDETKTRPAKTNARGLVELQPNAARPTFAVPLAYNSSINDQITFTPKSGVQVGQNADIAAEMTDAPRAKGSLLGGTIHTAAHATKSGRRAVVEICVDDVPRFRTGRYEGSISVYGPGLADFDYALVVTTKWPRIVPIGLIAASLLFVVLFRLVTAPARQWNWRSVLVAIFGAVVAIGLGALTYWGTYATNDTWGDDPKTQIPALVMASLTSAVAGWAAFDKSYGKFGAR
jgi:hypothetical protein